MKMLAILACTAAVFTACNGATAPNTADFERLPADQVLYDVEHAITFQGVRRSNLKTDTTLIFDDSAMIQLRGVNLEMYDEGGRVNATLTSKSGELNQNSSKMVARGTVVLNVRGAQPQTITTEELHYDPQAKRVWSDVDACQRKGSQTLCGTSFTSDTEFQNVQVMNPRGRGIRIQ